MLPPIFQTLTSSSLVTDIVGTKVFPYGDAPQDITSPYVTWHIVSGIPQNSLSEVPDIDNISVQIDCWHPVASGLEELAEAVRNRIEPYAHMTNIPLNDRDRETRLYRMTLQFDWWLNRDYLPPPPVDIGDSNIDGGFANSVYLPSQIIDGGFANSVYLPSQLIDGGDANG